MIKCVTGKKVYLTHDQAEEALIGARTRYEYAQGQGPVGVYKCEDCGYFHLTSQGPINLRLEKDLKAGKVDRQKLADEWERKMKHR